MISLLCITDPGTHPPFDTTVELYNRLASHAGIDLFHTSPFGFEETLERRVHNISAPLTFEGFLALDSSPAISRAMSSFDLVFSRADKPLPRNFHKNLGQFETKVRFVNSPSGLENIAGRSFLSNFNHFMPPNVFTRDITEATAFLEKFHRIVGKQELSYGGKGVFSLAKRANNEVVVDHVSLGSKTFLSAEQAFQHLFSLDSAPYQFVKFLSRIDEGDKRVLVVDGEIYGAYIRKAAAGSWVHNVTAGGGCFHATVTDLEKQIISQTAHYYYQAGVYTLGYDFLMDDSGEWILSEINAGNIGGYGRLESLYQYPAYDRLAQWLIDRATRPI